MSKTVFLDSETFGLTGPMILLQYAVDRGPIVVAPIWETKVKTTLELIELICKYRVVGFNLTFDWFHINKIYNLLKYQATYYPDNEYPHKEIIAEAEYKAFQYAVIPQDAFDILVFARQGPHQDLMNRKDLVIKRVPTVLAEQLAKILKNEIDLNPNLFYKRPKGYEWIVEELDKDEDPQGDFRDLRLRFAPSSRLDALAKECLGKPKDEWPVDMSVLADKDWRPYDNGWTRHFGYILNQWNSDRAKAYAEKDVDITRRLYYHFINEGAAEFHRDSMLACYLGAVRWAGWKIKDPSELIVKYKAEAKGVPTAPAAVLSQLTRLASPEEAMTITSSDKKTLEALERSPTTELAEFATKVIKARKAKKRLEILERLKILYSEVGRFFPAYNIGYTKTNRLSGGSGEGSESMNPQGIPREPEIRALFEVKDELCNQLDGGDFDSFEVTILAALYNDVKLTNELKSGKKFHGLMGEIWYDISYDEVLAQREIYDRTKNADFGWIYGAQTPKLAETLNRLETQVEEANERMRRIYPEVIRVRERIQLDYTALSQPDGIGTAVKYKEPKLYSENLFGFRRYYKLEFHLLKKLFSLAQNPPKEFKNVEIKVRRRDRIQTVSGAVQSALYAAAFNIQSQVLRQATNMPIQSTGADLCKELQFRLQSLQPAGCSLWTIKVSNTHDELMAAHAKLKLIPVIEKFIHKYRKDIELLSIGWKENIQSWKEIKG